MNTSRGRLLTTCFAALVATSFGFVLRAFVIEDWGHEFSLTETQKGELLGVGLWPFAISIVLFSLIIDRVGYRFAMWFAFACHVVSAIVTITATNYWSLYIGTFIVALGNGTVEAAVNPAIASAYSDERTRALNRLHAGWPAGLVLGGLLALAIGGFDWRAKIALILLPTIVYGALLLRQPFPVSERVAQGVPWREMLRTVGGIGAAIFIALMITELGRVFGWSLATRVVTGLVLLGAFVCFARSWGHPVFLALLLLMIPLATTELGTDSWISDLLAPQMQSLGMSPGWVLIWTSFLMMVLRFNAGPFVRLFTPLGLLSVASVIAAIGLVLLSRASGIAILLAATVYGLGKAFFWPTILGVVAERFPRGGALPLNMVAGVGMLSVGIVGAVLMGYAQDRAVSRTLERFDAANGTQLSAQFLIDAESGVLGAYRALDMRALDAASAQEQALVGELRAGARQSALRGMAVLPLLMALGFFALFLTLRRRPPPPATH